MGKVCTKCGERKPLSEFYKNKTFTDGLTYACKTCVKKRTKKYFEDNKEECLRKHLGYYYKNKEKISKRFREYYEENKETIKSKSQEYAQENKEKIKEYQKQYREKNKEKLRKYVAVYREDNKQKINKSRSERRRTDPVFKLSKNIRNLILNSLKRKGYTKKSRSYEILGCSYEDFLTHLNTNKYGFKFEDNNCDIDHIVALSTANTEEDLYRLNYYTNLQLLPSNYNRNIKKDNDWDVEHFENWLKNEYN